MAEYIPKNTNSNVKCWSLAFKRGSVTIGLNVMKLEHIV